MTNIEEIRKIINQAECTDPGGHVWDEHATCDHCDVDALDVLELTIKALPPLLLELAKLHAADEAPFTTGLTSDLAVRLRMSVQAFRMDPRTKQMLIDAADTLDQQTNELTTLKATLERERQLNVYLYNQGYRSGHNDTVEAVYTDIHHSDMNSYHVDVVDEFRPAALREGE